MQACHPSPPFSILTFMPNYKLSPKLTATAFVKGARERGGGVAVEALPRTGTGKDGGHGEYGQTTTVLHRLAHTHTC